MQGLWQLTAPASLCASLIGLTGCATHAELESLRAEVRHTSLKSATAQLTEGASTEASKQIPFGASVKKTDASYPGAKSASGNSAGRIGVVS